MTLKTRGQGAYTGDLDAARRSGWEGLGRISWSRPGAPRGVPSLGEQLGLTQRAIHQR